MSFPGTCKACAVRLAVYDGRWCRCSKRTCRLLSNSSSLIVSPSSVGRTSDDSPVAEGRGVSVEPTPVRTGSGPAAEGKGYLFVQHTAAGRGKQDSARRTFAFPGRTRV